MTEDTTKRFGVLMDFAEKIANSHKGHHLVLSRLSTGSWSVFLREFNSNTVLPHEGFNTLEEALENFVIHSTPSKT
jgi:hypothetical protein